MLSRRSIKRALLVALVLAVFAFAFVRYRMIGPYRDYRVNLAFSSSQTPADLAKPLLVGAAQRDISPNLEEYDPWVDADKNSRFEPAKGDTYTDRNGNGDFDFVWLGGFNSNRPAQGVNDPLWTRAIAFRHNNRTVVLVTIDSVGLTHERFLKIRHAIDHQALGIDHILFSSTHSHNTPDTMGIWSYKPFPSRFNQRYLDFLLSQTEAAISEAVQKMQPADTVLAQATLEPEGHVRDSRQPEIYDRTLCAARFTRTGTDETLATLVSWGNHPEAMGGSNPLISSDFPHYWREGVEKGLAAPNAIAGLGGICLFFQGPVGGLMTPLGLAVPDRDGRTVHKDNGIGKTRALGENLAIRTLEALRASTATRMTNPTVAVVARTIFAPIEGTFKYPIMLGLIHPGWFDGKARTEMNAVRIGEIEILAIPGEVYPEIVEGGIETPEGGDFPGPVREVPPLRPLMRGRVNMVFNLANDEIGYIIPRTQWDTRPPFTYGANSAPYGEVNSGGPGVAETVHREGHDALRRLHELLQSK